MPDQLTATPLALSDAFPVLLGPVRIEYRFTSTELLVRVFPDEWTVDTFEEKLTAGEQDLALRYWTAYWQAGGDEPGRLAAWRDLTSHVGPGRAGYVEQDDGAPATRARSLTAPASARSSWWWRRRIRCPRPTGPPA